jgi:hypothetical protein
MFEQQKSANSGCKPLSGGMSVQNILLHPAYSAGSAGYIKLGPFLRKA